MPSTLLWPRIVLLVTLLCVAFVIGRATAPQGITQEQLRAEEAELTQAERRIDALEMALQARSEAESPQPTESPDQPAAAETNAAGRRIYVVQSGDTMRGIAQTFCGDADLARFVASFNDIDDPQQISVGMEIRLPADCDE